MAESNGISIKPCASKLLILLEFVWFGLVLCQQPNTATTGAPNVLEPDPTRLPSLDTSTVTTVGRSSQQLSPTTHSTPAWLGTNSESTQSSAEVPGFTRQLPSERSSTPPPPLKTATPKISGNDVTESPKPLVEPTPGLPQELQTIATDPATPPSLESPPEFWDTPPPETPPPDFLDDAKRFSPFPKMDAMGLNFTEQLVWYHTFLCGDTCQSGERGRTLCSICHCDLHCFQFGDCCPQVFLRKPDALEVPRRSCPELWNKLDSFYMVTSCLPDLDHTEDGRKCKKPEDLDWRHQLPVTDVSTETAYRNRYCALCNNVATYSNWQMLVDCPRVAIVVVVLVQGTGCDSDDCDDDDDDDNDDDDDYIYDVNGDDRLMRAGALPTANLEKVSRASSASELFQTAVQEGCGLDLRPPRNTTARRCTPDLEPLISTCNVTGGWRIYDVRIERACAKFLSPVDRYRNAFCRLCNENVVWNNGQEADIVFPDRVSLVAVLHLQDEAPVSSGISPALRMPGRPRMPVCVDGTFLDPQSKSCRPLTCAPGKKVKDGKCQSVVFESNFLSYSVTLDVTLLTSFVNASLLNMYLFKLHNFLYSYLKYTLNFFVLNYTGHVQSVICNDDVTAYVLLTFHLFPRQAFVVDEMEAAMLTFLNDVRENSTDGHSESHRQLSGRPAADNSVTPPQVTNCRNSDLPLDDYPSHVIFPDYLTPNYHGVYARSVVVELTPLRVCKQVLLSAEEFSYANDTKKLTIKATGMTVDQPNFSVQGSSASVCLETYLSGFNTSSLEMSAQNGTYDTEAPANSSLSSTKGTVAGVVSLACSITSLVFLLLTFLIYCILKELRTTAGICTMCMVAVLFLAQAVFEFGAEQTEIAGLCVALGVLAHYLWLSATFWMNACTFLVFYRLNFPLQARVTLDSKARVLALTSLYALLTPALIVASTIAANFGFHGDLGYGGAICYVTRATTRRLGLALPIGCLVVGNLVLFAVTVVRLRRGPRVSSTRDSRVGLLACAKLSVITGLSWLFLFLHEAVPQKAVEYVAILLFGLYGVVVFVSLVLNQHVIGLIRGKIEKKRKNQTSSKAETSRSLPSASTGLSSVSNHANDKEVICTRL